MTMEDVVVMTRISVLRRTSIQQKRVSWLRSDVIDDSNRRSTKANNISAEENELLAWG